MWFLLFYSTVLWQQCVSLERRELEIRTQSQEIGWSGAEIICPAVWRDKVIWFNILVSVAELGGWRKLLEWKFDEKKSSMIYSRNCTYVFSKHLTEWIRQCWIEYEEGKFNTTRELNLRDKGVKKKLFSNLVEQEGGASSGEKNIQLEAVVIKPVF